MNGPCPLGGGHFVILFYNNCELLIFGIHIANHLWH